MATTKKVHHETTRPSEERVVDSVEHELEEMREVEADLRDVVGLRRMEVAEMKRVADELAEERSIYEGKIPAQRERTAKLRAQVAENDEIIERLRAEVDEAYLKVGRSYAELRSLKRTQWELHCEAAEVAALGRPVPVVPGPIPAPPPPVTTAPPLPPLPAPPRYYFSGTVGDEPGEWVSIYVAGSPTPVARKQTGFSGQLEFELDAEFAEIVVERTPGQYHRIQGESK